MRIAATASLLLAGLSLASYALTAFTARDWTIAGPGLMVAAAGVGGLRLRWLYFAGLIPIGAIVSVAGPVLSYDLARPDETPYFLGTVAIVVGGCLAAVFGPAAALASTSRAALAAAGVATALIVAVFSSLLPGGSPSASTDGDITAAERSSAVDVEMIDYFFVVDPEQLTEGRVVHLRNTGALPHDFTIAALDVAVFVPSGRDTYLRLPSRTGGVVELVCTVGDHIDLGMRLDLPVTHEEPEPRGEE